MKILDTYILKSFLRNFLIGILGFLALFFISYVLPEVISGLVSKDIGIYEALTFALYRIPFLISFQMVHLAALVGSILTMGRMSTNLEVVALKVSGISFKRMILVPIIFSILLSIGIIFFTNSVVIKCEKIVRKTRQSINRSSRDFSHNLSIKGRNNIFYHFDSLHNNSLHHFTIVILDDNFLKIEKIISALKGTYSNNQWTLYSVTVNNVREGHIESYEEYRPPMELDDIELFKKDANSYYTELSLKKLRQLIKEEHAKGLDTTRLQLHLHHYRIAFPLSILIMTIVGFSLTGYFSRGGVSHISLSLIIGFAYYVVAEISVAYGIGHIIPIMLSAWIPNIIFLILAIVLIIRAEH